MAVLGLERFAPPPIGKRVQPPINWLGERSLMNVVVDPVSGGPPVTPPPSAPGAAPPPTTGLFAPPGSQPPTIQAGGFNPDFQALIAADPSLLTSMADLDVFAGRATDARREAIRKAIVNAGLIPQGFQSADVDEATLEAARQNQFSSAAELERGRGRTMTDLQAALAARGLLLEGGGAITGGASRVQENFERGTSALTNSLLDAISGYERETGDKLAQITAQRNALRQQAAERVAADPRNRPQPGATAKLDVVSGNYVTDDGRIFAPDGTKISDGLFPAGFHGVMQTGETGEAYQRTLDTLRRLYGG